MEFIDIIENYNEEVVVFGVETFETTFPILVNPYQIKFNLDIVQEMKNVLKKIISMDDLDKMIISGSILFHILSNKPINHSTCEIYSSELNPVELLQLFDNYLSTNIVYTQRYIQIKIQDITFKLYTHPQVNLDKLDYFSLFIKFGELTASRFMNYAISSRTIIFLDNIDQSEHIAEMFKYGFNIMFYRKKIKLSNQLYDDYNLETVITLDTITFKYKKCEQNLICDGTILEKSKKPNIMRDDEKNLYSLLRDKKDISYVGLFEREKIPFQSIFNQDIIREIYRNIQNNIKNKIFPINYVENFITITSPEEIFKHRHSPDILATIFDKQIKHNIKCMENEYLDYSR